MTIQRYSPIRSHALAPVDDGKYVLFTDAQAAIQRARGQALEDAAKVADAKEDKYWRPLQVTRSDLEVAVDEGKRDCAEEIAAAIRAMKGKTDDR